MQLVVTSRTSSWQVLPRTIEFRYTPVDLYLMGLVEPGEVPGFRYLENPEDADGDGVYTARLHNLAITNIINEHGASYLFRLHHNACFIRLIFYLPATLPMWVI